MYKALLEAIASTYTSILGLLYIHNILIIIIIHVHDYTCRCITMYNVTMNCT